MKYLKETKYKIFKIQIQKLKKMKKKSVYHNVK